MGLEEKRWVHNHQENIVPDFKKRYSEVIGKDIAIEVDWKTFENDLTALQFFESCGLNEVLQTVTAICGDKIGRDALQAAISKVSFTNVAKVTDKSCAINKGTLEIKGAYAQSTEGRILHSDMTKILEKAL